MNCRLYLMDSFEAVEGLSPPECEADGKILVEAIFCRHRERARATIPVISASDLKLPAAASPDSLAHISLAYLYLADEGKTHGACR
jgi:hypothetical protein